MPLGRREHFTWTGSTSMGRITPTVEADDSRYINVAGLVLDLNITAVPDK